MGSIHSASLHSTEWCGAGLVFVFLGEQVSWVLFTCNVRKGDVPVSEGLIDCDFMDAQVVKAFGRGGLGPVNTV